MRRIDKNPASSIPAKKIVYKEKGNNKLLASLLHNEQYHLCAYTEEYISRTDKGDIEHFNPTLKGKSGDSYENWFLVKAQWNLEKGDSRRWNKFQPVMHPTANDFESRILYDKGRYILADSNDLEARNLRDYLKLDDEYLAKKRINYIRRLKNAIALSGLTNQEYVDWQISQEEERETIYYIRAIQEELQVRVNFDLLKTK